MKIVAYLKARLDERSTWAAFGVAIAGAAALDRPWDYVAVAAGVIGALVPSPKGGDQ